MCINIIYLLPGICIIFYIAISIFTAVLNARHRFQNLSAKTVQEISTTRDADRIYMFEHGEIAEQGTHDELMALNGEYAEMFEKQAHYYKLKI